MCGIAGVFFSRSGRSVESSLVTRMTDLIVHRGPDDAGQLVDRDLGIGMRRLSIIDLSAGHQPVFNEDQSIAVVFNGEIYNFQEIRDELVAKGHQFRTHSDTEVIVHLYEEMGADFPRRLNGMFAIALWDSKRRRLVVVRDRLGVKPVYYAWTADGLVFGSELKCVLADRGVSREIDQEALYQYLTLGYIPNPMSIHRDVRQLPPGARIVVEGGEMRIDRYWRLNAMVDRSLSRPDAEHKLRDLLSNATKLRMISDVPLGAFLSGGLDSSIVVALMAKQSSVPVKTFYIDFDEPEYSEREFARAVAQRYGTDHHELVVRPSAVDILDRLVAHYDEPFADSSAIPTWFVSQLTREHVTVALAGDGGDESFGGYTRYQRILAHREFPSAIRKLAGGVGNALAAVLPRTMTGRDAMRALGYDYGQLFAGVFDEAKTRELLTPEFLRTAGKSSVWDAASEIYRRADPDDRLARYALLDLERYLPDDILAKVDRASMAHSLEVRAPFLDYRVVELAASFPMEWKIAGSTTKAIVKSTFGADLPPEVLLPRKRGFSIPLGRWLRTDLKASADEAIHHGAMANAGIINFAELQGLWAEHLSGVRDRSQIIWRYLFLERWWRHNQSAAAG